MSVDYFTDRDLGRSFPEILRAAGVSVERHAARFPPDGSDEQWLEYVGHAGRVALTHDKRIRYKTNERDAVMRHGVRLIVVVGTAPLPELARNFVRTMPRIEEFLAKHSGPFIAGLSQVFRVSA